MRDPVTCLPTHSLRPLTLDDLGYDVPKEYLAIGALICPECGLIYSREYAGRHGETRLAA